MKENVRVLQVRNAPKKNFPPSTVYPEVRSVSGLDFVANNETVRYAFTEVSAPAIIAPPTGSSFLPHWLQ